MPAQTVEVFLLGDTGCDGAKTVAMSGFSLLWADSGGVAA